MPTKRVELNGDHLKEAREAASSRLYSAEKPLFFADVGERGLLLRVRLAKAEFILKFGGKTRKLADLGPERANLKPGQIRTIKDARELARKARALLQDGTDPKPFLTGLAAGKAISDADASAADAAAKKRGDWDWEELVRQYCDVYLSHPRVNSRGVRKEPSLRTVKEARRYLLMKPYTDALRGKLLARLDQGDLESIRNAMFRAGLNTASRQFVAYSKAALSYARDNDAKEAGLLGSPHWWREVKKRQETIPAARTRKPALKEIAKTLYAAEKFRTVEGRAIKKQTTETVLCSLWWLALSAQRAFAGLALQKAHILPWPEGPDGWKVVYFPNIVMKGRRPHALPIPPRLVLLLERAMSATERESSYVFPASRLIGGARDGHLSRSAPNLLLQRLRGRAADLAKERKAKKKAEKHGSEFEGLPDLLGEMNHFSPHDFRRSFATVCADMTVRADAISAVLDHVVITGEPLMAGASITQQVYDHSQRLDLKAIAMKAWTDAVFAACDAEWAAQKEAEMSARREAILAARMQNRTGEPLRQMAPLPRPYRPTLDRPEKPVFSAREPWYVTYERWLRHGRLIAPPPRLIGLSQINQSHRHNEWADDRDEFEPTE